MKSIIITIIAWLLSGCISMDVVIVKECDVELHIEGEIDESIRLD